MKRFCIFTLLLAMALTGTVWAQATAEVFVQGSPLRGANGAFFDQADRLYVASVIGRNITVLDPGSGAVLDVITDRSGVETPDDVVVAPDGTVYWTALLVGRVGRLSPDGEVRQQEVTHSLNSIALSDDGRLYVSQCGFLFGSEIYELDPALEGPPRLITDATGMECGVNGMDVGADGFIYGPRFFQDDVIRIDPDSGDFEVVAEGFDAPSAVKFDSAGNLYVTDFIVGEVVRVDVSTGAKTLLATLDSGLDNLAIDSQDRIYVTNNVSSEITEVRQDGSTRIVRPGGLAAPGGIVIQERPDGGESLFVADFTALVELDARSGAQLSLEDSTFRAPLDDPSSVDYDGENFLISSWSANSVQVWNHERRELLVQIDDFQFPLNAIFFDGDLIVSELGTGSVVRADRDNPANRQTLMDGLVMPTGLAASDDDLYVADWFQGSVWQVIGDGVLLDEPRLVAIGLAAPEGLAIEPDGTLLVVETDAGRLSRIDPATRVAKTVATGLDLGVRASLEVSVPTTFFSDVAVSPATGDIFVSGDVNSVIYRIEEQVEGTCVPRPTALCVENNRFQLTLDWRTGGNEGLGRIGTSTGSSGLFYFFDPENWEVLAKLLDGCDNNGHYWVYAASATDIEFDLRVEDTVTGAVKTYHNAGGEPAPAITDSLAFPCRP